MLRIVGAALLLAACGRGKAPGLDAAPHDNKFSGIGGFGREAQAFLPCGLAQEWWLEFDARSPALDRALAEQDGVDLSLRLEECGRKTGLFGCDKWVYLELAGVPTESGRYGHMGWYSRELRVTKVLRAARDVPPACEIRRPTSR
jgi:hypothetical protein